MKKEQLRKIVMLLVVLVTITALGSFTQGTEHTEIEVSETLTNEENFIADNQKEENTKDDATDDSKSEDKINSASEKVIGNVSKKDKRIAELTDKYNDSVYGNVAYCLEIAQKYSLPICFIGITMGAFNFLIIGNKKLDKKEQGFGWIVGFTIGLVVFNVIPLIFALFVAGR